ncbi:MULTISPECIES: hypothetical protein [Delftia]|uniref:Uncharacterized protein n=1 Tax=Delftia acidovorans TaxID=80866 RepID=A0A7T2S3B3_DELAC|nr:MULTISPECIES: hypothetical protein [Delftia]QPS08176.1 hypothetical protein I6G66_28615 [Delftia acidovorans]
MRLVINFFFCAMTLLSFSASGGYADEWFPGCSVKPQFSDAVYTEEMRCRRDGIHNCDMNPDWFDCGDLPKLPTYQLPEVTVNGAYEPNYAYLRGWAISNGYSVEWVNPNYFEISPWWWNNSVWVEESVAKAAIKELDSRCTGANANHSSPPRERLAAAQMMYDQLAGRVREGVFSTAFRAYFGWARRITVTFDDGSMETYTVTNLHASVTLTMVPGTLLGPGSAGPVVCLG